MNWIKDIFGWRAEKQALFAERKALLAEVERLKARDQRHFDELMSMRDRLSKIMKDEDYDKMFRETLKKHIRKLGQAWFHHAHDEYFNQLLPVLIDKMKFSHELRSPHDFDINAQMSTTRVIELELRIDSQGYRAAIL